MSLFVDKVVAAAEAVIQAAIGEAVGDAKQGAVIGVAPAGAGKSYAVVSAVLEARRRNQRVVVATPTNEQAFALLSGVADRARESVVWVPRSGLGLPEQHQRRSIVEKKARDVTDGDGIVVGTLNKLGDAFARGDLDPFDLLLVDEAYQATSVHYYMVGGLAPKHLLMGDSGQLAPFSSAPDADRWRGLGEDPLLTAVDVLVRNHPKTRRHLLPITRRLDPRAIPVVNAFYPRHPFDAAVRAGVRRLTVGPKRGRGLTAILDRAIEQATEAGWAHLELPETAVVTADPAAVELIARLLLRFFGRNPTALCEKHRKPKQLAFEDVAVVVSHNDQKDRVRAALRSAGLQGVTVDTANKMQGLTFEVVVAWHPLAGLADLDDFHLDPGRLCVMLTRHRHACFVVGRAGDRKLIEGIPPASPAYVGWDPTPALDGWYAHEGVFRGLEAHRIAVSP